MRDGISGAARTIAVLSPDYLKSQHGTSEWEAAWRADPLGADRKLLTVQVRACATPARLTSVVGVELFGITEAEARSRLRAMVAGALTGRAKPGTAPPFPDAERAMPDRPVFPDARANGLRVINPVRYLRRRRGRLPSRASTVEVRAARGVRTACSP